MHTMYKRRAQWEKYKKLGPDELHEVIKNRAASNTSEKLTEVARQYLEMVQVVYQ